MIEFVLCIAVASIVFETIDFAGLLTTWPWKCEQSANDVEAKQHGLGNANKVRTMWKRIVAKRRSLHLFVRMHLLRELFERDEKHLSELRRRIGPQAAARRQKVVGRPFWPPPRSDEVWTLMGSLWSLPLKARCLGSARLR